MEIYYEKHIKKSLTEDTVDCPSKTYPSVPCEIIHAGAKVKFRPVEGKTIKGAYQLEPTNNFPAPGLAWDAVLCNTKTI